MYKKLKLINFLLTIVLVSLSGCNRPRRPDYVRIDDPSFEEHVIYDIAETIVDGEPLMVAVGDFGSWTSSDSITWNYHAGAALRKVEGILGQGFYAVGANGGLYRSSNGEDWDYIRGSTNSITLITGGRLLTGGLAWNSTNQYLLPAVFITENFADWERHVLEFTTATTKILAAESSGDLIVVGGGSTSLGAATPRPRIWYSEDNGETWHGANGPFLSMWGQVELIVVSYNNVFYAVSNWGSQFSTLWKSTDGKTWVVVQDVEVANSGEQFAFYDAKSTGQSNVMVVVGLRDGAPALWNFNRTNSTWRSSNPSFIYGDEPPTELTGVGSSANIAPAGYLYTGYRTVEGKKVGAIWLRRP